MELNDKIYREIAKGTGHSVDTVEKVCKSMFEFVTEQMEAGEHRAVRLQYMGVFRCKPERLKKLGIIKEDDGKL